MGNSVTIRGKAKYLGGVGTKVTGISRRQFKPNLQTVHVTVGKTNKTHAGLHPVHPQRRRHQAGAHRPVQAAAHARSAAANRPPAAS